MQASLSPIGEDSSAQERPEMEDSQAGRHWSAPKVR